jgi:hypothetical protein
MERRGTHAHSPSRTGAAWSAALSVALLLTSVAPAAAQEEIDERTEYLLELLQDSPLFRVRTQAALSLGAVDAHPRVVTGLAGALGDDNAAVRAASASSLERLEDPTALSALRAHADDDQAAVRSAIERAIRHLEQIARSRPAVAGTDGSAPPDGGAEARYYLGIGRPGSRAEGVPSALLERARAVIVSVAGGVDGVDLAPQEESSAAAAQVLRQRRLTGFYLDSSLVSLEERANGAMRAQVSVVIQDYPGRNIRSMLRGAATVSGGSGDARLLQQQAVEAAFRSALRNLGSALSATAAAR